MPIEISKFTGKALACSANRPAAVQADASGTLAQAPKAGAIITPTQTSNLFKPPRVFCLASITPTGIR